MSLMIWGTTTLAEHSKPKYHCSKSTVYAMCFSRTVVKPGDPGWEPPRTPPTTATRCPD